MFAGASILTLQHMLYMNCPLRHWNVRSSRDHWVLWILMWTKTPVAVWCSIKYDLTLTDPYDIQDGCYVYIHSLKLTEILPETLGLEDEFPFGFRSLFRSYVSFRESSNLIYTLEVQHSPWKMVVGRLLSYWDVPFSGAMLNFGGVFDIPCSQTILGPHCWHAGMLCIHRVSSRLLGRNWIIVILGPRHQFFCGNWGYNINGCFWFP